MNLNSSLVIVDQVYFKVYSYLCGFLLVYLLWKFYITDSGKCSTCNIFSIDKMSMAGVRQKNKKQNKQKKPKKNNTF